MGDLPGLTWPVVLAFGNLILSSAIVITAFSLLGYMLTHNLRSAVAQTFSILLACVLVVFAGDIVAPRVETHRAAVMWLRVQWIGIAMVPAAYLHFSDAILRTTHHFSLSRRMLVGVGYVLSGILVGLALFTDVLVYDGLYAPPVSYLRPGPLFPLFVLYFVITAAVGAYNVYRARKRCLTPESRRRMTYLTISLAAPGIGVFPYLVSLGLAQHLSPVVVLLIAMAASFAVGTMLVVMAYSVAYHGTLTPDRVIKQDLIQYLLRGPIVGTIVIVVMLVIPRVELILGLPRDTALIFAVVGVIVLGQLAVDFAMPWIERLLFSQDREEILWIQTLEQRLLTSSELSQFLRNVLSGLCELLRVDGGFVLAQTESGFQVEAVTGSASMAQRFAASPEAGAMWQKLEQTDLGHNGERGQVAPHFHTDSDFWFCPLRSQDGEKMLGLLAVRARSQTLDLNPGEIEETDELLAQAAVAIADRYVQNGVFVTLQRILPDLGRIQAWRNALRYGPPQPSPERSQAPGTVRQALASGDWQQWVKDALTDYWGGPKLTESPLAGLGLVARALQAQEGNLTRALRSVLEEAIERQRPSGERKLGAADWLLYNILELRFIQGQRVRDIARRLAISESDLYRKQRIAIAEVARTLAEMEAELAGEEAARAGDNMPELYPSR